MVDWLIRRAQRTPYFHLDGYMHRWWLVPYTYAGSAGKEGDGTGKVSWRRPFARLLQACGVAIRVHEILRSDIGRDPHDHPWPYITIILKGGYWEERYDDWGDCYSVEWHGPGSVLIRKARDLHKLMLPPGHTTHTLFMTGPYQNGWGFLTPRGKVGHKDYRP